MQNVKQVIMPILKKYGFTKAALVGSYSRGDFSDSSDIDLVVEPPKKMSLLGLVRVQRELEELLGKDVDLLTYNGLHPYVRHYILSNEQVLYG
ncbi:MAG: nucleotidyltransferase family protein [bacterium]|nr:nucleotidyltransferase family protein [bacterium]